MEDNNNSIRQAVREHYGELVNSPSCCGPEGCDCGVTFYDPALIETIADPTGIPSFGCGDPVTIAELKKGQVVLDLGSGAGLDCFLSARQVGQDGRVIGVDMTPEMLVKAEENKAKLGLMNVEFRQGFIEDLPVEDASVDVVMSNCVINLSPDKLKVFQEAYRVLRKGGKLAVSDVVTEGSFTEEARHQLNLWAGCVTGAIDIQEYVGGMRAAGFVDIEVKSKGEITLDTPEGPRVFNARFTAIKG